MLRINKITFKNEDTTSRLITRTVPDTETWYITPGADTNGNIKGVIIDGGYVSYQDTDVRAAYPGQSIGYSLGAGASADLFYIAVESELEDKGEETTVNLMYGWYDQPSPEEPIIEFTVSLFDEATYTGSYLPYTVTGPEATHGVITTSSVLSSSDAIIDNFDVGDNYLSTDNLLDGKNTYYFHLYDGTNIKTLQADITYITDDTISAYGDLELLVEDAPELTSGVVDVVSLNYSIPEGVAYVSAQVSGIDSQVHVTGLDGNPVKRGSALGTLQVHVSPLLLADEALSVTVNISSQASRTISETVSLSFSESSMRVIDLEEVVFATGIGYNSTYKGEGSFEFKVKIPNGLESAQSHGEVGNIIGKNPRSAYMNWDVIPTGSEGDVYTFHCEWVITKIGSDSSYGIYPGSYRSKMCTITDQDGISSDLIVKFAVN